MGTILGFLSRFSRLVGFLEPPRLRAKLHVAGPCCRLDFILPTCRRLHLFLSLREHARGPCHLPCKPCPAHRRAVRDAGLLLFQWSHFISIYFFPPSFECILFIHGPRFQPRNARWMDRTCVVLPMFQLKCSFDAGVRPPESAFLGGKKRSLQLFSGLG